MNAMLGLKAAVLAVTLAMSAAVAATQEDPVATAKIAARCAGKSGSAYDQCTLLERERLAGTDQTPSAFAGAPIQYTPEPLRRYDDRPSSALLIAGLMWLLTAALTGYVASGRGRSSLGWGLAAVLISPVLAYATLVGLPMRGRALLGFDDRIHSVCKECSGPCLIGSRRCMQCGAAVVEDRTLSAQAGEPGWNARS